MILFILSGVMVVKSVKERNTPVTAEEAGVKVMPEHAPGAGLTKAEEEPEPAAGKKNVAEDTPVQEAAESDFPSEEVPSEEPVPEEEAPEPLEKYDELLKVNPYVAGWLDIEGSPINAPVVYTPRSQNYFIHRSIDGSYEERGCLFIAAIWRDTYNNTLIYGHNMKDGSGFGSLMKYTSEKYGREHNILKFDTLYEEREYELLGVFYSEIKEEELETKEDRAERDKEIEEESIARKEEEGKEKEKEEEKPSEEEPTEEKPTEEAPPVLTLADLHLYEDLGDIDVYREEKDSDMEKDIFRYYYFTDLTYKTDYDYFVKKVKEGSLYDTGVDAQWGDELLTLSTCSYQTKNGRLVVVAKRRK